MATEYTPNYNLDLYVSKDKPNLRDQYNSAMRKIDAQLKTNAGNTVIATTAVGNLDRKVDDLSGKVDGYDARITANTTGVGNLTRSVNTLNNDVTTIENTLANNTAPKDHADTDTIYGAGTLQYYGHVKLTDSPSRLSGANGIAASPLMVDQAIQDALGGVTPGGQYAPIDHKSAYATYGVGDANFNGHVKLADSGTAGLDSTRGYAATPKMVHGAIDASVETMGVWKAIINIEDRAMTSEQGDGTLKYDLKVWVNDVMHLAIVQYHHETINIPANAVGQRFTLATLDEGYHPKGSFGVDPVYFLGHNPDGTSFSQALSLLTGSDGTITLVSTPSAVAYSEGSNVRGQFVFYF